MSLERRNFLKLLLGIWAGSASLPIFSQPSALQTQIIQWIKKQRLAKRLTPKERTAWVVYDLTKKQSIVNINGEALFQCASLVKIFVVQAYLYAHFRQNKSAFPLNRAILGRMQKVIVQSDNDQTNYFIKQLGGIKKVQGLLKKQAPHIFKNIRLVEAIPAYGRTYQNKATPNDYLRFLRAVWQNELVGAKILKTLMGIPNPDRLKTNTQKIPFTTRVYDKTGSTAMLCGNVGILEALGKDKRRYPYIVIGLVESKVRTTQYKSWIKSRGNIIRGVSDLTYLHFKALYNLT